MSLEQLLARWAASGDDAESRDGLVPRCCHNLWSAREEGTPFSVVHTGGRWAIRPRNTIGRMHVLMGLFEALEQRDWPWRLESRRRCRGVVWRPAGAHATHYLHVATGDEPSTALLTAYLGALEARQEADS